MKKSLLTKIAALLLFTAIILTGCQAAEQVNIAEMLTGAQKYLAELDYEQAIIEFNKILEIDPMNVDAYIGLADAYLQAGDVDSAIRALQQGYERTTSNEIKQKLKALVNLSGEADDSNSDQISIEPDVPNEDETNYSDSYISGEPTESELHTETEPDYIDSVPEEVIYTTTSVTQTAAPISHTEKTNSTSCTTTKAETITTTHKQPEEPELIDEEYTNMFTYEIIDETVNILRYVGENNVVEIPELIDGYPVTSIETGAFKGNLNIISVIIPDNVKILGAEIFKDCTGLKEVIIGSGIEIIPEGAFRNCTSLNNFRFGMGINQIFDRAFQNSALTSIVIPDSIEILGAEAFRDCMALKEVIIGFGVGVISEDSFRDCTDLVNLSLANGVQTISDRAFMNSAIQSIIIPDSVETIGVDAFNNCINLEDVVIGSGVQTIRGGAFKQTSIVSITIPDNVLWIGSYAFENCKKLTNAFVSGELNMSTFLNCINLSDITFSETMTSIPYASFFNCYGIKNLYIPASITSIGAGVAEGIYGCNWSEVTIYGESGTFAETYANAKRCTFVAV